MTILILGTGCARCTQLFDLTRSTVEELGWTDASVEKIESLEEILNFGILSTPGLVIDGTVVLSGKVPDKAALTSLLMKHRTVAS